MLVSNVLLVNLLIAMMSETYSSIKENADVEWKFGRVSQVIEAMERTHALPPPFSLPLMLVRFLWWMISSPLGKRRMQVAAQGRGYKNSVAHS